jgi:hypothetical protein
MMITIDDFAKKYNIPVQRVEHFFRMLKINTDEIREFDEEKMRMFLQMMK